MSSAEEAARSSAEGHPGAPAPPARPLRARAIRAASWTLAGQLSRYGLRLASNLVLTRLLFPEAFGLMALVTLFFQALQMFSDLGIGASIVREREGESPTFLDTAWTLQILRGGVLWLASVAAAVPFSRFYGDPQLATILPVAGVAAIVGGFNSTALFTHQRRLTIARVMAIDLGSYAVGVVVMISWALASATVWALVAGNMVTAVVKCVASHRVLERRRHRIAFDRASADSLYRFGRWLFVSTALTFFLQQGDRAVLGRLLDMTTLGVYSIAFFWSRSATEVMLRLNRTVLLPVYSQFVRERPDDLARQVRRTRLLLLAGFLPVPWVLSVGGQLLVGWLYDARYVEAGWMLRILALGAVGTAVSVSQGSILLAAGDSARFMVLQTTRGLLLVASMAGGWHLAGLHGLVTGVALSKFLDYPVLAWAVRRHGVWLPGLDALAVGLSLAVVLAGWAVAGAPPIPGIGP